MAIVVPAWLNDLFFALMGERMPQANEDLAYVSHEAFSSFSNKLRRLADLVGESIGSAGQVLPPQVAKDYVRAVDVLTDDGGTNHITELAKQLDDISDGRVKTSISIAESKINILLELAILAAELLFLAVMSFFTGGATSGEAVEAKLRTRARILVILEMLAKRTHLLPTLSEALEEAFTTLAARLALILTAAPGRKPHGIDMKDVVLSGVTGGLTSIFDHLFHGGKSLFKKLFKDKADIGAGFDKKFADKDKMPGLNTGPGGSTVKHGVKNPAPDGPHSGGGNLLTNTAGQGFDAVGEGAAETFAESVVYQQPLSFSTFHGAVVSSLNTALIFTGVQKLGLGLRDFVFPKDLGVTPNRASAGPATGPAGTGAVDGPDQGTHVPTTGTDVPAPVSYAPHDLTEAGPPPVTTTGQTPAVSAPTVGAGSTQSAGPAAASGYGGGIPVESPGQAQVPPAPTTSAGGGAGTRPPLQTGPDAPTAPGHDATTAPDDTPTALAPGATTAPGATLTDSASGPLGAGAHLGSQGSATGDGTASHDVSPGPVEDESATDPGSLTTPGEDPSDAAGSVPGQTAPPASRPGTATGQAAAQTPGTAQAPGTRQTSGAGVGPGTVQGGGAQVTGDATAANHTATQGGQDRPRADDGRNSERDGALGIKTVSAGAATPATTAGTLGQDVTGQHTAAPTVPDTQEDVPSNVLTAAGDTAVPGITPPATVSTSTSSAVPSGAAERAKGRGDTGRDAVPDPAPAETPSASADTTPDEDVAAAIPMPTVSGSEPTDAHQGAARGEATTMVSADPVIPVTDQGTADADDFASEDSDTVYDPDDDSDTLYDSESDSGDTYVGSEEGAILKEGGKAAKDPGPPRSHEKISQWLDGLDAGTTHPLRGLAAQDVTVNMLTGVTYGGRNLDYIVEIDHPYVSWSAPGRTVWRNTDEDPSTVFRTGFRARNPENLVDIVQWVTSPPSEGAQFVSSTRDRELPKYTGRRYQYEIRGDVSGVDMAQSINRMLDAEPELEDELPQLAEYRDDELEVAFVGGIPAHAVVSVLDRRTGLTGRWDPATQAVEWSQAPHAPQASGQPAPGAAVAGGADARAELFTGSPWDDTDTTDDPYGSYESETDSSDSPEPDSSENSEPDSPDDSDSDRPAAPRSPGPTSSPHPVPAPTRSSVPPMGPEVPRTRRVLINGVAQEMTQHRGFHRFTAPDGGGSVYISDDQIDHGETVPAVADLVVRFLDGGLPLYRVHPQPAPGTGHPGERVTFVAAGTDDFPRHDDVDATVFVELSTTPEAAERRFDEAGATPTTGTGLPAGAFVGPDRDIVVIDAHTVQVRNQVVALVTDHAPVTVTPRTPPVDTGITVMAAQVDKSPYERVLERELAKDTHTDEQRRRLQRALDTHGPAREPARRPGWDLLSPAERSELTTLVARQTGREADGDLARRVEEAYRELPGSWYSQPLVRRAELVGNKIATGRFFPAVGGSGRDGSADVSERAGEPSAPGDGVRDQPVAGPSGTQPVGPAPQSAAPDTVATTWIGPVDGDPVPRATSPEPEEAGLQPTRVRNLRPKLTVDASGASRNAGRSPLSPTSPRQVIISPVSARTPVGLRWSPTTPLTAVPDPARTPTDATTSPSRADAEATRRVTAAEVIRLMQEMASQAGPSGHHTGHLGPDLFGLRRPAPAPEFLVNPETGRPYDHRGLDADQAVYFLNAMDMKYRWDATEFDPAGWTDVGQFSHSHHRDTLAWTPSPNAPRLPSLDVRTPAVVHAIWFGGPPRPDGPSAGFWERFGTAAHRFRDQAVFVLWTDVARADIEYVSRFTQAPSDPEAARVWALYQWAEANGVKLVNVQEVFNESAPMGLHDEFMTEMLKGVGPGWAAASDIARLEILDRFGGFYTDGDNEIGDLGAFEQVTNSREGYAVGATSKLFSNSALAVTMGHPFPGMAKELLRANYTKTQPELLAALGRVPKDGFTRFPLRPRRHSVMRRTGPDGYWSLLPALGLANLNEMPQLGGLSIRSDSSWSPENATPAAAAPQRPYTAQETAYFTAVVVQSMVRSLLNRNGDLHLTQIESALDRHDDPDLVWESALGFLASRDDLRSLVKGVTRTTYVDETTTRRVQLPPAAEALLLPPQDAHAAAPVGDADGWWLGERSEPVRMAPAAVEHPGDRGRESPSGPAESVTVGEITTPYDAWEAFAARDPGAAQSLLHRVARDIPEEWGESHDAIRRAYGRLTPEQRRTTSVGQAALLTNMLLAGEARTGLLDAGARPRATTLETGPDPREDQDATPAGRSASGGSRQPAAGNADATSSAPRTRRRVRMAPPPLDLSAPSRRGSRAPIGSRTSATQRTPRTPGTTDPARTPGTAGRPRDPQPARSPGTSRTTSTPGTSGTTATPRTARTPRRPDAPASARTPAPASSRTPRHTDPPARSARTPGNGRPPRTPAPLRTPRTPTSGGLGRHPRTPVSPGHVRTSTVRAMRRDPEAFLKNNVVSLDMAAGLRSYAPRLSSEQATKVVAALNDTSLRRHWFVLVEVDRDTTGKPVFMLAPAVEKYAQQYPDTEPFNEIPPGRLPVRRDDAAYLEAGFIPYLTGSTSNLDTAIGHAEVVRDPSDTEFSPDFVVTPTMNGCALAITAGSVGGRFTAWHFQSPSALSNVANAERFRRTKRPTDWYGDGEYYDVAASGSTGGAAPMFETTNMLWRGPDGWRVLSQESRTGHMNRSVTWHRFQQRPVRLTEGGELRQIAAIYQGMARAEAFEDNAIAQRYRNILLSKPQRGEEEKYRRIETVYNLIRAHVRHEIEQIGDARDFESLQRLAANFRLERAAYMPGFVHALPELRDDVPLPLFNKAERNRLTGRVQNVRALVQAFMDNSYRNWISRLESEAGDHARRPTWDRLTTADRQEVIRLVSRGIDREADPDLARRVEDAYRELPDSWYSQPLTRRADLIGNKITSGAFFPGTGGSAPQGSDGPGPAGEPSAPAAAERPEALSSDTGTTPDETPGTPSPARPTGPGPSRGGLTEELTRRLAASPLLDTPVTRQDLAGLAHDPALDLTWQLAPDARVPVRDAGLSPVDQARVLLTRPDLDPDLAADLRPVLTPDAPAGTTPASPGGTDADPVAADEDAEASTVQTDGAQVPPEPAAAAPGARRPWPLQLEEDADGYVPNLAKRPADFPASRAEAWQRYLASYGQVAELRAAERQGGTASHGVPAPDSDGRTGGPDTHGAARLRLGRDEEALRAWGHPDPEGLLLRYRAQPAESAPVGTDPLAPAPEEEPLPPTPVDAPLPAASEEKPLPPVHEEKPLPAPPQTQAVDPQAQGAAEAPGRPTGETRHTPGITVMSASVEGDPDRKVLAEEPGTTTLSDEQRSRLQGVLDSHGGTPPAAVGGPAMRLRGGASDDASAADSGSDVIDDWATVSDSGVFVRRSPALAEIDRTLEHWKSGSRTVPRRFDDNERDIQAVLSAIGTWRAAKHGRPSRREAAVDMLERRLRDELDDIAGRREAMRPQLELRRRYDRISPGLSRWAERQPTGRDIDPDLPLHRLLTEERDRHGQLTEHAVSIGDDMARGDFDDVLSRKLRSGVTVEALGDDRVAALLASSGRGPDGRTPYPEIESYLARRDTGRRSDHGSPLTEWARETIAVGETQVTLHHDPTDALWERRRDQVLDSVHRLASRGLLAPGLEYFLPKYGRDITVSPSGGISVNSKGSVAQFFAPNRVVVSPHAMALASAEKADGYVDGSPEGVLDHEAGHAAHRASDPFAFHDLTAASFVDEAAETAHEVSEYAGQNPREFVAEVFTGLVRGKVYSPQVLDLYAGLGGPAVPRAGESSGGVRPYAYPVRPEGTWESTTRRVLREALLDAVVDGKAGTPYMAGLLKALDVSRAQGPAAGTGPDGEGAFADRHPLVGMALTQDRTTDAVNRRLVTAHSNEARGGRAGRVPAAPDGGREQAGPDMARILPELRAELRPGRRDALGGDPFGVRQPKPAPRFMRPGGRPYDFSELHADQRRAFFARVDLKRRTAPTADEMAVRGLPRDPDSVVSGAYAARSSGIGRKRQKVAKLLHSIWYGPLFDDGPNGARTDFRSNIAEAARRNPRWLVVHWTDVTRAEIDAVRDAFDPRTATERQRQVKDMLEWADGIENLALVNEDEIYNADTPMTLQSEVLTERARGGKSLASASDMSRVEHLHRFGGVYSDGDNRIFDLSQVARETAQRPDGFALLRADLPRDAKDAAARDSRPMNNAAMVSTAASAATQHYLRLLAENYRTSLAELLRRGAQGLRRLGDDVIGQEATPYAAVHKPSREVTHRTGPNTHTFTRLAAALGHTDPGDAGTGDRFLLGSIPPDAIKVESRGSWNVGFTDGAQSVTHERLSTAVRAVVVGLHAELHNRPGGLLLKTIDDTVRSLGLPETLRVPVWDAALTLFQESLGPGTEQVRWIASGREVNPPQEAVSRALGLFPHAVYVHSDSGGTQGNAAASSGGQGEVAAAGSAPGTSTRPLPSSGPQGGRTDAGAR